eukprot:CAMPEP_0204846308 /NCGR_PEP_ID=MMETSP1347-20130617/1877_1 /ASSEMBLY_ACC=CAM_ASM_000690 /TAXON_ID=215587 /ORGANISM="Aplanochytrium stocchinoi, Strain GSBS06" /LENGTH=214 /DNA_ID=CAMNT_0051986799 /DNA_START=71 /DNA_END=715 /DNA_ORIENTATION=+
MYGLSEIVESLNVDERKVTFESIRHYIQLKEDGIMCRRTLLYRDILNMCEYCTNPHGWTESIRRASYRIGYLTKDDIAAYEEMSTGKTKKKCKNTDAKESVNMKVPVLIPLKAESDIKVIPFLREHKCDIEIVIVPLGHVGPACDKCCQGCAVCTSVMKHNEQKLLASYRYEGRIYTTLVDRIGEIDSKSTKVANHAFEALAADIEEDEFTISE